LGGEGEAASGKGGGRILKTREELGNPKSLARIRGGT